MMKRAIVLFLTIAALEAVFLTQAQAVNFTQLTTDPNGDYTPDWSPLGDKIAFASYRTWPYRIWVIPSTGGTAVQLSDLGTYGDGEPKWSPDANYILFQSRDAGARWDLFTMTNTGGSVTRRTFTDNADENNPDWAPDGAKIVWRRAGGEGTIVIRNLEGGSEQDLTYGEFPSWSPDGGWIAYDYQGDIYVISSSGGDPYQLTTDPARDFQPDWSPDGARIAFTSERSGNTDIWVMDSRGESYGLWQITTYSGYDQWPAWSPDGAKIAFSSARIGNEDIWIASNLGIPGTGPGWISGVVQNAQTANPLHNATVRTTTMPYGGDQTDPGGNYSATLPAGTYEVEVSAPGYQAQTRQVELQEDQTQIEDFDLAPLEPDIEYRGPSNLLYAKRKSEETDWKISSGDHVHLYLDFVNEGGDQDNFWVTLDGLEDNGGGEWFDGIPAVSFSLDQGGPYEGTITVDIPMVEAGRRVWIDLWMYVHNLHYDKRLERRCLYGRDPSSMLLRWNSGAQTKEKLLHITLEPIDFRESSAEYDKYVREDCLHDYRGVEQRAFFQFAAGDAEPGKQINPPGTGETLYGDADSPSGAIINAFRTIRDEFEGGPSEVRYETSRMFRLKRLGRAIGDCENFSDLMCSFGRSIGLPTRFVESFELVHGWNEVYYSGGWHYADIGLGWVGPWQGDEWGFIRRNHTPEDISNVWVDGNPLSSAWMGSGPCGTASRPTYNSYCLSSSPNCYLCVTFGGYWNQDYEEVDCNFEYWMDRTHLYQSRGGANHASAGGHDAKGGIDSLRIILNAPVFVHQNVSFDLIAVIFNCGPGVLLDADVELRLGSSMLDTIDIYSTPSPVIQLDSLLPYDSAMITWNVTPLVPMDFTTLTVAVAWETNILYVSTEQIINEYGTQPDLLVSCRAAETSLGPGDSIQLFAWVVGESLQTIEDASVMAQMYSYPDSLFYSTSGFSYSTSDSAYVADCLVPPEAPVGHYVVEVIADKIGYDSDSSGTRFDVLPELIVTASATAYSCGVDDTVSILASVADSDSILTEASVLGEATNEADTLLLSLVLDSLSNQYQSELVFREMMKFVPAASVQGGIWDILVTAQYSGASDSDVVSIEVSVPDLSIGPSDISFDATNPEEGDLVTIFAKIHNTGDFISDSSEVSFFCDFINDYSRIGPTCPLPPVPPGDSVTVAVMWNTFSHGGEKTIYAFVDPDSTTVQSSRENDIASQNISVGQAYFRGDVNNDQTIDVGDVVYLVSYLYRGGAAPQPFEWIGDVNCDGGVTVGDVVYLINYLYRGGPAPC